MYESKLLQLLHHHRLFSEYLLLLSLLFRLQFFWYQAERDVIVIGAAWVLAVRKLVEEDLLRDGGGGGVSWGCRVRENIAREPRDGIIQAPAPRAKPTPRAPRFCCSAGVISSYVDERLPRPALPGTVSYEHVDRLRHKTTTVPAYFPSGGEGTE